MEDQVVVKGGRTAEELIPEIRSASWDDKHEIGWPERSKGSWVRGVARMETGHRVGTVPYGVH